MSRISDISIIRHFFGFPIHGASPKLHKAAIVCLNASWWQNPPDPTTEFGIAEFMVKGASPTTHCENIINGIRNAHARVIPNAHLLNQYTEDGDSEAFNFGTTKFVSLEEAKKVLINTFVRAHMVGDNSGQHPPIILVGHALENRPGGSGHHHQGRRHTEPRQRRSHSQPKGSKHQSRRLAGALQDPHLQPIQCR